MADTKKAKKIVLMGLDAAGKSSILLSLQNDTRLSSYMVLPPTLDIKRSVITDEQNEFFIFDFGGQEGLRNGYMKNLDQHLGEVDKVIFVIDIKDVKRHEKAIDYLANVVEFLAANPKPPSVPKSKSNHQPPRYVALSIFFHKYDMLPGGKEDKSLEPVAHILAEKLARVIPSGIPYEIHRTSVYVLFQKNRIK